MDPIVVRRVQFPLSESTPRYWYAGDPFMTHFMNALSSTFPDGEAFFVRSVRKYQDLATDPAERDAIRAFCAQEGMHGHQHDQHIALLDAQGYPWIRRLNKMVDRQMRWANGALPKLCLANTAALEHLTAILARQILRHGDHWVAPMHPDMQPLWRWHAIEEAEHKAVAFDVLAKASGSYVYRVLALIGATFGLAFEAGLRMTYFLAKDGLLLSPRTAWRGLRLMFRPTPAWRELVRDYFAWFRPSFHPSDMDDRALIAGVSDELRAQGVVTA